MMADYNLRAIITAVDKLSPVLKTQARHIRSWSRSFKQAGSGAVPMAAGLGAAMLIPARAFMQAEDAATQLQNTLMTSNGLSSGFKELSAVAVDLGNKLPGTTADFLAMGSQLKALGVDTDTLIGGALKASAYLAVVGKPLGVTYETAAESVGKLANAFGIAKNDLLPFADTVQRALHLGIDLTQLQYAMARVSGPLKSMGMQGLKVANDMVPLVSMLVQAGVSGEDAGTGIRAMINAQIKAGRFTGVKSLVADLEAMDKLNPADKLAKFTDLFGEPHAGKASIIAAGGFAEMVKKMEAQASLTQRVNNSLGTLTNLWDAATGTFTNAMVAFANSYAPQLKQLAQSINDISGSLQGWVSANGPAVITALQMVGALAAVKLAMYGVGVALAFVSKLMTMNPLGLFLQAVALAVPLIIALWGPVGDVFKKVIDEVTYKFIDFHMFVKTSASLISDSLQQAADYFKSAFGSAIDWVSNKFSAFTGALSNIGSAVSSMFAGLGSVLPPTNSMTLPGKAIARSPIVGSQKLSGVLDINHNNAPAGFRAAQPKTRGPFKINQNVGYNWSVTGL